MLRPVPIVLAVLVNRVLHLLLVARALHRNGGYFVPYVVLVVAVYVERRVLPKRYLRSAPSLVAEGFCGQCGYSLRELPVQLDSCIVCSECGAAWNQQRVTWAWWNHAEPHWSRTGYIFSKPESARAGRDSLGRIVSIRTLQDLTDLQRDADGERKAAIAAADRVLMLRSRWKRVATAIFMLLIFGVFGATMLTESYQPRFSLAASGNHSSARRSSGSPESSSPSASSAAACPAACLLGATGTGKTFTMANVIARLGKPTLIISHNKTLAAQLYEELREFFPNNSVNYFVSYYDYYQPEAYIPSATSTSRRTPAATTTSTSSAWRPPATSSAPRHRRRRQRLVHLRPRLARGLRQKVLTDHQGRPHRPARVPPRLNAMQYQRSEIEFKRGTSSASAAMPSRSGPPTRSSPSASSSSATRSTAIDLVNPTSGEVLAEENASSSSSPPSTTSCPRTSCSPRSRRSARNSTRASSCGSEGKLLEAQRLLARTKYDLEMLEEVGFCNGIENYSRFMDGRQPGSARTA
jgi:hypothetical protein